MLFWTALLTALIPAAVDFLKSDSGQQVIAGHQQMMGGLFQNLFGGNGGGPGGPGGLLGSLFGARQNAAGAALQSFFPSPLQGGGPGGLLGGIFGQ